MIRWLQSCNRPARDEPSEQGAVNLSPELMLPGRVEIGLDDSAFERLPISFGHRTIAADQLRWCLGTA